jgi:hypothetical protein
MPSISEATAACCYDKAQIERTWREYFGNGR